MKEQLKVNPSRVSILSFRRGNALTDGTQYTAAAYPGQSVIHPYRDSNKKFAISPVTIRTLSDLVHEPVIIGVFIIAVCIVGSVYALSQWYYADFDPEPIPTEIPVSELTASPALLVGMDLSRLSASDAESDWKAAATIKPIQTQSERELHELTREGEALLPEYFQKNLPPLRKSPYGLGPYPEIPPDFPKQNIFDRLERHAKTSHANISHELIYRVLIKLWNQGKKTDSAIIDGDNGRVYPLYKDTVYVTWSELEHEDGSIETYMESYLSHIALAGYEDSVANGTQPSWLKVVQREDGGIAPYSFLDLP